MDTNTTATQLAASTWQDATADVRGTYLTAGATSATRLAGDYLTAGILTPGDYVALARWAEGRPSYVAHVYAPTAA